MRNMMRAFLTAFTVLWAVSGLLAADYVVIVSKDSPMSSISLDMLKKIYLGQKTSWDAGGKVMSAALSSGPAHEAFLKAVTAKTPAQFQAFWKQAIFTGSGVPPKSFSSEAELAKYVGATRGAVGYVSAAAAKDAKVVAVN